VDEGQMKETKKLKLLIVASRESVWRYRGPGSISCFVLLIHLPGVFMFASLLAERLKHQCTTALSTAEAALAPS
jgi:hypothetical protein